MSAFVSGLLVAGYLVAGLFFLGFWRHSRDRLFLLFAAAFAMLALQRGLLAALAGRGDVTVLYSIRLAAFLVILYAIWDKNRPGTSE